MTLMIAGYFGSKNLKGTYSAIVYTCPNGYTNYNQNNEHCYKCPGTGGILNDVIPKVRCMYPIGKTITCYVDANGDTFEEYKKKGYLCVLVGGSSGGTYKCTYNGYTQKNPQITDITKTNNSAYNPYACYTRNDTNETRV